MFNHTEIFRVEDISSPLIFKDRHILSRPCLLDDRIFPSTRVSTCSLIGVPAGQVIAQKTSARIRNTHRSMDKSLDLHILRNLSSDLPNLCQGKLPCRHNTLRSLAVPEQVCSIIRVVCLSTDMARNLRADFFCNVKDTRIRDNQRVRTNFL